MGYLAKSVAVFRVGWLLVAALFTVSFSWIGFLPLGGIWLYDRLSKRRNPSIEPVLHLPNDRVITLWRILLILMALSAVGAPKWTNAIGATVGFALASYLGLASAAYFNKHENDFLRFVIKPLTIALVLSSLILLAVRIQTGERAWILGFNPNMVGTFLMFGAGVVLGYWERLRVRGIPASIPLILATVIGIYATESRGAAIGFVATLAFFYRRSWKYLVLLGGAIVLLSLALVLDLVPYRLEPDPGRMKLWELSIKLIQQHPRTGIGLNNFWSVTSRIAEMDPNYAGSTHAHNILLNLGVEVGLIGLFVFIAIIAMVALRARGSLRSDPQDTTQAFVAALFGLILREQVDTHLISVVALDVVVWLVIGLLILKNDKEALASPDAGPKP